MYREVTVGFVLSCFLLVACQRAGEAPDHGQVVAPSRSQCDPEVFVDPTKAAAVRDRLFRTLDDPRNALKWLEGAVLQVPAPVLRDGLAERSATGNAAASAALDELDAWRGLDDVGLAAAVDAAKKSRDVGRLYVRLMAEVSDTRATVIAEALAELGDVRSRDALRLMRDLRSGPVEGGTEQEIERSELLRVLDAAAARAARAAR